jgi:hypothetical protein
MLAVPWQLVLKQAPLLMSAAGDLFMKSRSWSVGIATAKDLNSLRERCAELAKDQQGSAELVKQLTEQLNAVTEIVHATAAKSRRSTIVGAAGVALGLVACVLALLR